MRVIAGSARRVRLDVAPGSPTRPFLEKARGALFNSLAAALPRAMVLDLYAGSGALGIEALSRGAAGCVFVERDAAALRVLEGNVRRCGFEKRSRVLRGDAGAVVARLKGTFNLIFVDPPFPDAADWSGGGGIREIALETSRMLVPGGVLVFRLEGDVPCPASWGGLPLIRENCYGRSRLCRYGMADGTENG